MDKYRIVEHRTNDKTWYQVEKRFLWFFWNTVTEFNCDIIGHAWEEPKKFDTRSSAEYFIKRQYEPLRSIIRDRQNRRIPRHERIQDLICYFGDVHCEDPLDGTTFDCDVLNALSELRDKYEKQEVVEALK